MPIPCPKRSLPLITFFDANLVVGSSQVNLRINLSLTELVKKSRN
jgi:hypothetical protein